MATQTSADLTEEFRQFIIGLCNTDPGAINADGKWHRFRILDTRHKTSKPGCYLLHLDGKPNGVFMDWRDGNRHKWFAGGSYESIDREEVSRRRESRRMEHLRAFQFAAEEAADFWKSCSPLSDGLHPFLTRKGIIGLGTRQGSGKRFGLGDVPCVIVPLSSAEGHPMTLQAIREDGERRFWPGSTHEGAHFQIGKDNGKSSIVFCEGFSTAASIRDATGHLVVMCVNAANMAHVARWAGHKWHGRELIVAGDDDWHLVDNPKVKRNVGLDAATNMARAMGARLVMPDMAGLVTDGGDDFNDMAREYGLDEVGAVFSVPEGEQAIQQTALPLEWFDDIQAQLEANWLVDDLVPAGGLCLVYGHPGCGKSFFALDLTLHVARGAPWRGRDTKPGLIVYVGAEGQRGLRQRISAFRKHHNAENLPFALIPVEVNMLDRDGDAEKLCATIEMAARKFDLPVAAVVLDTLSRTFGGGDEVGPDMVTYINNGGRVQQQFNCAEIVIHHRPKDSANETPRGHGSLWGACDTIILVEDKNGQKTARVTKQKDAEPAEPIDFDLTVVELGTDEKGRLVTSCVVTEPKSERQPQPDTAQRFSDQQKISLSILQEVIKDTGGFSHHGVPDIRLPKGAPVKVSRLSDWASRTGAALCGPDTTPDSAARAFRRYRDKFQALNIIGIYEDWVWLIDGGRIAADRSADRYSDR